MSAVAVGSCCNIKMTSKKQCGAVMFYSPVLVPCIYTGLVGVTIVQYWAYYPIAFYLFIYFC